MYDFYDRLMKGESAEDIAKSVSDELNKAQKKKEEAEKAKVADQAKQAKAAVVVKAATYHPDLKSKLTADDFIKTMEATSKVNQFFDKSFDSLGKAKDKTVKSVDDLIDDFLTKMGW